MALPDEAPSPSNPLELGDTTMVSLDNVLAAEDGDTDGLQALINAGMWSLQGSMGRAMMGAIEDGRCMLGPNGATDYWGNHIPGRDDVQAGSKGSYDYVVDRFGKDHADHLLELDEVEA